MMHRLRGKSKVISITIDPSKKLGFLWLSVVVDNRVSFLTEITTTGSFL